ncbi:glycoside hydrolase family 88 protein [Salegentibacter sp. F188]|uniref:Glycoside hydrolase family 88 protein n=1 Tax=Autumnicola patrickiae TaxID=3075591 RepID=A0ABU3DYW7_9FLAO|nr:glycoside hydrolase family 88 protein [Salegentibacter sp. F188]MDT0688923.1 glycoside hydrolase family 88 protein [Salegentibacter sp. F188]
MNQKLLQLSIVCFLFLSQGMVAQINDANTPLHLLKPEYPTPYGTPDIAEVEEVLDRVYEFLDEGTPAKIINTRDQSEVIDFKNLDGNVAFAPATFRLTSYEWGVTYAGMLLASEATGKKYFEDYTDTRIKFLAEIAKEHRGKSYENSPVHSVLHPGALDDAGAICAAMIKAERRGLDADLRPVIDNFIQYISEKQYRLEDGTLARNRPQDNTLWLDDLFMSVPALAQMGKLTGEEKYFDDAVKQVKQFSERMYNEDKGLYMHGWVEAMEEKPQYHWARANGWAVMAMVELLEVLPEEHSGYQEVLHQLQAHIRGLAKYQDGTGFWHQLLDRPDTYLETSATAIFTYSIARAINRGYVDKLTYGPMTILGWNAVSTQVNNEGQVEGTCVGTGMGFDPAFYYYRPINKYAAHGYGPVLLAGAEVILMLKDNTFEINDSSLQLKVN